jgi:hypothetical protein
MADEKDYFMLFGYGCVAEKDVKSYFRCYRTEKLYLYVQLAFFQTAGLESWRGKHYIRVGLDYCRECFVLVLDLKVVVLRVRMEGLVCI